MLASPITREKEVGLLLTICRKFMQSGVEMREQLLTKVRVTLNRR